MVYAFLAVLAGAMISSQSSCNGVLYPYIGVLGVGFISPFLNAVFSYIFHLVSEKKPTCSKMHNSHIMRYTQVVL